jgi:signal peptidase II
MRRWLLLSVVVVVIDQATKWWVKSILYEDEYIPISSFLNLVLAYNEGAAFSFLNDAGGWQRWLFVVLALVISAVLYNWLTKLEKKDLPTAISLVLILGGAWGNLVDRVYYGKVTDFIDLYYGDWHWPAFNVADGAISAGVILMLYCLFRFKAPDKHIGG